MSLEFSLKNIDVRQNEIPLLEVWKPLYMFSNNLNVVKYFGKENQILITSKMRTITAQED